MVRTAIAAACALTLLAACGDGDDEGDAGGGGATPLAADLNVIVRPDGPDGPVRERRIECERLGPGSEDAVCRRLAGLTPARLAPVPRLTACTSIYGGPAVGRVTGTIRGEPVDARFSREDGCQINRWDRNADLLGAPGGGP
jgi:hypothetical protein